MILEVLIGILAILFGLHLYLGRNFDFWKKKGIPYMKPTPFFGNFKDRIFLKKSIYDFDLDTYKYFKGKRFGGYFEGPMPFLWIQDPELVRCITIKDFDHFVDRRSFKTGDGTFDEFVSVLTGQQWKEVRSVLTPAFSSGKMKRIFSSVVGCSDNLLNYLKRTSKIEDVEMKDCFGRYTMDVVATAAFGVKCNCYEDKEAEFPKMANQMMKMGKYRMFVLTMFLIIPKFFKYFKISVFDSVPINFFKNVVQNTIDHREKHGIKGNDFLQLLLDARKGELNEEEEKDTAIDFGLVTRGKAKHVLTDSMVLSQSVLFFIAGFETTSTALSFAAYELALNPEVQERLYDEVKRVVQQAGGITYEAIQNMEYMDMVISESQRIHPGATRLERLCVEDYKIPDSNITIDKGTILGFSVVGFHMDSDYFPEPERFDPERFSHESKSQRSPYVYMPFGIGPRNCIGMRFALMEAKAALANIILNVKLIPCEKTQIPIVYEKANMVRGEKGIWLNIEERQ